MAKSLAGKAGPRTGLRLHRSPKHSRTLAQGSKKLPALGNIQGLICCCWWWPWLGTAGREEPGSALHLCPVGSIAFCRRRGLQGELKPSPERGDAAGAGGDGHAGLGSRPHQKALAHEELTAWPRRRSTSAGPAPLSSSISYPSHSQLPGQVPEGHPSPGRPHPLRAAMCSLPVSAEQHTPSTGQGHLPCVSRGGGAALDIRGQHCGAPPSPPPWPGGDCRQEPGREAAVPLCSSGHWQPWHRRRGFGWPWPTQPQPGLLPARQTLRSALISRLV